jgi:hypothetical protein
MVMRKNKSNTKERQVEDGSRASSKNHCWTPAERSSSMYWNTMRTISSLFAADHQEKQKEKKKKKKTSAAGAQRER